MRILFINKRIKVLITEYYAPLVFAGILSAIFAFFTQPTSFQKRYFVKGIIEKVVLDAEITPGGVKGLSGSATMKFYKIKLNNSSNIYIYMIGTQMPNKKHKEKFLNKKANIEYWYKDNRKLIRKLIIDDKVIKESGYYGYLPFLIFVALSIMFLYIGSYGWYLKEWKD